MKRILSAFLAALLAAGTGCAPAAPASSSSPLPAASPAPDPAQPQGVTLQIGTLLERTENNFQHGLDYEFQPEELAVWQAALPALESAAGDVPAEPPQPRYFIRLYDETETEIACFLLDAAGALYTEDGRPTEDASVFALLEEILARDGA